LIIQHYCDIMIKNHEKLEKRERKVAMVKKEI